MQETFKLNKYDYVDNNNDIKQFKEYISSEIFENIYLDYNIHQNNNFFKFGIDSFLLSKFFLKNTTTKHNHIADFCSGTGIIGIYSYLNMFHKSYFTENLSIRKTNIEDLQVDFFEIQQYFANLNYRNCLNTYNNILQNNITTYSQNNFTNPFSVYNISIGDMCLDTSFKNKYSCILSNPPYMKENKGISTSSTEKNIAKIAKKDFLSTFFTTVQFCLKDKGELFMVHKPENLPEIIIVADKHNIELKALQFITNSSNNQPSLFLAKFVKNGNKFLNILPIKSIN